MRVIFTKILIVLLAFGMISCSQSEKKSDEPKEEKAEEIILVKIMPPVDWQRVSEKDLYLISQMILFPPPEAENLLVSDLLNSVGKQKDFALPNDDSFLKIYLKEDVITLNLAASHEIYMPSPKRFCCADSKNTFQLSDTNSLENKLRSVFSDRENAGVYAPNSSRVVKALYIDAPLHSRFGDVVKIASAAQNAGAEPIFLKVDRLEK